MNIESMTYKQLTAIRTDYEWRVEEQDEYGDIIENHICDSYAEALSINNDLKISEVCLVKLTGSHANGLEDVEFAYVGEGDWLYMEFDVPKKFIKEVENNS